MGPAVLQSVAREFPRLQAAAPLYNWVALERLHLTLNFLGDVPDRDIPDICKCIQTAIAGVEEFEVEIVGIGAFPHHDRPRVVWAGVGFGRDELSTLQARLAAALQQLGFASDRETFKPHLTLGRAGREGAFPGHLTHVMRELEHYAFGVSSIDEVVLYASYREKSGPHYVPMASFDLAY